MNRARLNNKIHATTATQATPLQRVRLVCGQTSRKTRPSVLSDSTTPITCRKCLAG